VFLGCFFVANCLEMRVCNLFIVVNAFIQYDHNVSSQNDSVCYGSSSSIKIRDSYRDIPLYSPICHQFGVCV
jgi:hypothetical protein